MSSNNRSSNDQPLPLSQQSVTAWLGQLKSGDSAAAQQLWQRYLDRLIRLAHRKLGECPQRAADEEDVVLSAFHAFLHGVDGQRFARLSDRDDLWQILAMLTERKAIALMRREGAAKRGAGQVRGESAFGVPGGMTSVGEGIGQLVGYEPTPQFAAELAEQLRRRLASLEDDQMRQVALAKLEGYTNQELAQKLGTNLRAVERQLRLIRRTWQQEFDT